MTEVEPPLNVQQAAGLRALADAVEGSEELGDTLNVVLRYMSLVVNRDARSRLELIARVLGEAGFTIGIENAERQCTVRAWHGPLRIQAWARDDAMMDNYPAPAPYPPLAFAKSKEDAS